MAKKKLWSVEVTKKSFALDLEEGVFTWDDPLTRKSSSKNWPTGTSTTTPKGVTIPLA